MERHGDEVDMTTDEARGGSTPHIVRYVLLISLFLAAAAMTVVWVTGALNRSDDPPATAPASEAAMADDEALASDFTLEEDDSQQLAPAQGGADEAVQ